VSWPARAAWLVPLGCLVASAAAAGPLGPAPRDREGRFLNLAGPLERAGPDVTLPFFLRRALGRFRRPSGLPGTEPDAQERLAALARAPASVTWVNHASVLVRMDGAVFLTDPIWAGAAGPAGLLGAVRVAPAGLALDELPPLDFVLVSHDHYDSLDLGSLRALAARGPQTRFVVPLGVGELLRGAGIERVHELDWSESLALGRVRVHCLPSQHWSRRGPFDERRSLWAAFAVVGPERRFFFGGDSGYFAGYRAIGAALGPFDLAALPIGAYEPQAMMRRVHLDPEEAVQAGGDLRARRLLAIHFGTFDLADEPLGEPPRRFRAAAAAAGFGDERAWVLRLGESRAF
jgi:N-acyl-phosphatidylethanolamine-hydrolysing phospholipase D